SRLIDRQFRGTAAPASLKREARDQLLRMAQYAYANGGMELYMSLQTAGGFPLPASLVVTLAPPHDDINVMVAPSRLAKTLSASGRDQVTLADLPVGQAVRVRRQAQSATLDIHVPVPESGAYLLLSFSTPLNVLADAMVSLFDSIASTLRWVHE
ncbi:MAG TPA: hypothetical protein VIZ43_22275, partial [Trebonia sp.]